MREAAVIDIELQLAQASFVVINTSGHSTHSFYTGIMSITHSPSLSLTLAIRCFEILDCHLCMGDLTTVCNL